MANPFDYRSKHVVVTGGATGVGDALLRLLDELGAPEVTVLDIAKPTGPHKTFIPARSVAESTSCSTTQA
jgi:NAD(P)-dependent dehydrogenase (short-subunit alcohol dehydrogenase family)